MVQFHRMEPKCNTLAFARLFLLCLLAFFLMALLLPIMLKDRNSLVCRNTKILNDFAELTFRYLYIYPMLLQWLNDFRRMISLYTLKHLPMRNKC